MIPPIIPLTSDTPRLYTSIFRASEWYGATQTHFPPRPRNSQWHCVIFPHGLPIHYNAFRTRRPPKVMRTVSKTSVSYETSSKSHASSLQDKRFVRDFLQKSRVMSPKQAFHTRLPPKVTRQSPKRAFRTRLTQKLTCQSLQNERFVRDFIQQSECHSDIHLYHNSQPHDSLRLPRIFPRPHV